MPMMISTMRVARFPTAQERAQHEAAFRALFGACSDVPRMLPNPHNPNEVALCGQVHDLEELRRISRTPEGDALMRQHGLLEQLAFYIEADA